MLRFRRMGLFLSSTLVLEILNMAIEHQSISTQGVHRTSSDLIVQIVDGIGVVNIHHDFDIGWTLWDANEWVGFLSQMLDGLVFGFPPKIIQRDGLVLSIKAPHPVATQGSVRRVSHVLDG